MIVPVEERVAMVEQILTRHSRIMVECAVAEPLRRMEGVELHPDLFHTPLIYEHRERRRPMEVIYERYLEIAREAKLPLLLTAPTWRLDARRVKQASVPESINADAVSFLVGLRDRWQKEDGESPVMVGALVGPKEDCYRPDLAPGPEAAMKFHQEQIAELAGTEAELLVAQTIPAASEALGLARVLAETDRPYVISFCTGTDGRVLDGTPLPEAMQRIDEAGGLKRAPLGYFVNCTHPTFHLDAYDGGELERLIGIQANGSSKDVRALDASSETVMDPVEDWVAGMMRFSEEFAVPMLGGCCGTTDSHLSGLALGRVDGVDGSG
ncbi:MAG: homocysteine S-methyltransferase family protein [Verrucomicrobiota bacterium]